MSTRELIEKELAAMPKALQREAYDFARFLRHKIEGQLFDGQLLSESALARDWSTPEEDAAWASLLSAKKSFSPPARPLQRARARGLRLLDRTAEWSRTTTGCTAPVAAGGGIRVSQLLSVC